MATGWATANGQWSYFEKSGAMVADRAVPASDGESYVIGKDGYLANRKDSGYNIQWYCQTWDGQEYLLNAKGDDVIIEKMLGISDQSSRSFPTNMGMRFQIQP